MACTIEILEVLALESDGGNITRAQVSGTATECGKVVVKLKCPQSENVQIADVHPDGSWAVEFVNEGNSTSCHCGDLYMATAHCEGNEGCAAEPSHGQLGCPNLCPIITLDEPVIEECNDDGTHTVSFTAHIDNGGGNQDVSVHWEWEENGLIALADIHTVGAGLVDNWTREHDFPTPGNYSPRLVIDAPLNCPPYELDDDIRLEEECPRDCPQITGNIGFEIDDECHADGRDVTFNAEIVGIGVERYHWDFDDGQESEDPPPVTHRYNVLDEGRLYNVTLTIVGPTTDCIDTEVVSIEVPQCEFPDDGGGGPYESDEDETGGGGGGALGGCLSVNCATLLYISIFILVIATILAILSCFFPPLLLAAIISGLLGFGLFGLWAWLCSSTTPCWVMQRVHCFLFWMIAVVFPVIIVGAVIAAWLGISPWCPALAAAIGWGGWGSIYAWLGYVMRRVDCERRCG